MLLRVPGIGYRMAARIIRARRVGPLTFEDLKRMRVVLKRARYFITCNGRYSGGVDLDAVLLYPLLSDKANKKVMAGQISMFG